jgi:hypothetical protein
VTIVAVDGGAPTRDQIATARTSNVCSAAGRFAAAENGSARAYLLNYPQRSHPSASGPSAGRNTHSGAVLAASVEKAARAIRPVLVALLSVAIALFGIASLPPDALPESRANKVIVRHREEIAGLGAAAFVAVVIAFLLG